MTHSYSFLTFLPGVAAFLFAAAIQPGFTQSTQPSQGAAPGGSSTAAAPLIRVLSPAPGEKLETNFVRVVWELTNPAASADPAPTFKVQLDSEDAISTSTTEHTFTGLTPGSHVVYIQLVDANQLPLQGGTAEVRFSVAPPNTTQGLQGTPGKLVRAAVYQQSSADPEVDSRQLPSASGALPLVSVIGFGALIGGIISALKTR